MDTSPAPSSATVPEYTSGSRVSVSPVSFMVFLHKGFRRELAELKRLAVDASGACDVRGRGVVVGELMKRIEFLRSLYRHHCVAEAEVIFSALDARVKNITCTYNMQHHSTNSMFEAIFACLRRILDSEEKPAQLLQELIFHIGILQDSICQHMVKEEKQVFALLLSQFSADEQVSLVRQVLCSLPVMLVEDLLPWLASFLSPDEQLDLKDCIRAILNEDKSTLQEVLIFWIDKTAALCHGDADNKDNSSVCPCEQCNLTETFTSNLLGNSSGRNEDSQETVKSVLVDGLLLLHAAIRSDFEEILDKLNQTRSETSSRLTSLIAKINLLIEVLIFHSNTLERVLNPLLEGTFKHQPSLLYSKEVVGLKKYLYDAAQMKIAEASFLEMLCSKVESLLLLTCQHLSFLETEVLPLIGKNFNDETQQKLVIRSLRMLSIGVLKCIVIWYSSRLPKENLKPLLHGIELSCFLDKPLASLLHEWIHTGFSGKSSADNLQEIITWRAPYKFETASDDKDPCEKIKYASQSSLESSTSYAFQSSGASDKVHSFHGTSSETVPINFWEPRPMDHIYYFHKAIKKDLESLVVDSAKLPKNLDFVTEFSEHFRFVRSLYELHSETEDKIAFPALEANPYARNLTQSYSIDHEMETECFERVSAILSQISELHNTGLLADADPDDPTLVHFRQLCLQLEDSCKSLKKILEDHILREETELWPLFREFFSIEEQEKILGYMLGRTRVESLQEMIVWLMAHLTVEEQHAIMTFWLKATKWTKFNKWLEEWWEDIDKYYIGEMEKSTTSASSAMGSMDSVLKNVSGVVSPDWRGSVSDNSKSLDKDTMASDIVKKIEMDAINQKHKSSKYARILTKKEKPRKDEYINTDQSQLKVADQEEGKQAKPLATSEIEASTRLVPLIFPWDLRATSRVKQSLLVAPQPQPDQDNEITCESGMVPGQYPSYRDTQGSVFGCKHYKQNCKLFASCCNRLFTCRRCHDEEIHDHAMERKSTTQMMCMKCLQVQPIGQNCSTSSCNGYSMARYYCRICKLFDDSREIYHCPYCNICRVGKGLGIDYFHCMRCNACMGRALSVHVCIEKLIEDKCPICQEDMFTSANPVKSLNCGHVMHSSCFRDYTCLRYTCPICSKSLGNMQVYFEMLDALLAEEKMPEEYSGQSQAILCNDCEKKGTTPFHFVYHKCPYCGSYNTRLL